MQIRKKAGPLLLAFLDAGIVQEEDIPDLKAEFKSSRSDAIKRLSRMLCLKCGENFINNGMMDEDGPDGLSMEDLPAEPEPITEADREEARRFLALDAKLEGYTVPWRIRSRKPVTKRKTGSRMKRKPNLTSFRG